METVVISKDTTAKSNNKKPHYINLIQSLPLFIDFLSLDFLWFLSFEDKKATSIMDLITTHQLLLVLMKAIKRSMYVLCKVWSRDFQEFREAYYLNGYDYCCLLHKNPLSCFLEKFCTKGPSAKQKYKQSK